MTSMRKTLITSAVVLSSFALSLHTFRTAAAAVRLEPEECETFVLEALSRINLPQTISLANASYSNNIIINLENEETNMRC